MRRRDLVAGVASVAVLGGAGAVATGGVPGSLGGGDSGDGDGSTGSDGPEPVDPVTLDTVEAPGSRDGEVTLPAPDRPTFVDFFGTWCPPCVEQMPALGDANDRVGDRVLFVSVTTEAVGRSVTEAEIAEWWTEHDGGWLVGADPTAELAARANVSGYPTAAVIDAAGRLRWSESGIHTADELVAEIEAVL